MAFAWTDLPKFFDIRKVPAQIWLALALASGAALFAPSGLAGAMGVDSLRVTHRAHFGAAFIVALAMLLSRLLTYLGREGQVLLLRWRDRQNLRYLGPDQKALLKRFLDDDVAVLNFEFTDAVAESLESLGLIHRFSRFDMAEGLGFAIIPWLRLHLKRNPHLLEGAAAPREIDSN
ncbi:super-infection exclusion protein B [Anaeromyxobacter oryzae]|uniref:Uncharacterized protein n=1 Tax=Anaeromyxobacter oryzae TaxID=2918170 RepID=A0ABM7WZM2_9BACT|nr:super-infection exclusion protein B [Anaeromyxobacter oryzae]BDG04996.1 hypothetical protein AMOR_39920 [Anaeromyxobacter oryzae]